jgi:hypothetical protein
MKAVDPDQDIIVCGQCGSKNKPTSHEVGKALVCGNCKTPLEPSFNRNEVVYYQKDGWLVTQGHISTPAQTIRVSDVQRIEMKRIGMSTMQKVVLALLCLGGCVCYLLLDRFTLNWPHILWCAAPAIIWSIVVGEPTLARNLVAYCSTGTICLKTENGAEDRKDFDEFAKAIGRALEHSKSEK